MKGSPKTALVLAAGLGTRMGALGQARPKPLVEVAGKSLINRVLDQLAAAGISKAIINVHHMASMLEDHLALRTGGPDIVISDERGALLDTGGGIKNALPLIGGDPFMVLNSDALWADGSENTLKAMWQSYNPDKCDILLGLVAREQATGFDGNGDYRMDDLGHLTRQLDGGLAPFIFTGIRILSPSLIAAIAEDKFPLLGVFDTAEAAGRLKGYILKGHWFHVGTPEALAETEKLLDKE